MTRRPVRRLLAAALVVAALASGCGGGEADRASGSPSPTPSTLLGAGSDIVNDVDARPDVETLACRRAEDGSWLVRARTTNPTDTPVRYRLALRLAAAKDGAVLDRSVLESPVVAAGGSTVVETRAHPGRRVRKVNCVFVSVDRENVSGK